MISQDKTYLFTNIEVKLTGRFTKKIRTRQQQEVAVIVYEVTPVENFDGIWKKWANEEDLLEIQSLELPNDNSNS